MGRWLLTLLACACSGCTTASLLRHSVDQTASISDLRYREVLDNLALIAHHPDALPAYSIIFTGSAQVTDSGQVASTTLWQRALGATAQNGFGSETLAPQLSRTVLENWTLDPVAIPEKLEAMRCACRWVLFGPEHACDGCPGLLASPEQAPCPGRHFGVADRLERLPAGWLHVGRAADVPRGTCYAAHYGPTWVWVAPEGMRGLADFTLVLQDIARVSSNSSTLFDVRPTPSAFVFPTRPVTSPDGKQVSIAAAVSVGPTLNLVPDTPYYRWRLENPGSDAHLRSQISAAGLR